jgi:UDP:flavonoid glycosyltransferase YjiC (YdhE family)
MARIAFAWELGGEYGHVMSCAGLARGLDLRGHRIAFMFRELRQLAVIPEAKNYDVFQAPRTPREGLGLTQNPDCYADIMLACGYRDAEELTALVGGWRALLARWRPDLVVVDFGPTALLAARTLGIPCVTYGNGFFVPPRVAPLPPFRIDDPVDLERVARVDAFVLANVNSALRHFGSAPLLRLADLFDSREDYLCTFPEIDHYGDREVSGYWGPRVRFDRGAEVEWPQGPGKRVFVYVKRDLPQLDALIDVLAGSPHRIVSYIPELDAKRRARLTARNRVFSEKPIKLEHFLRGCDLLVSHGGEIATGSLTYGVPALLFPTHYEQYLTARRLQRLGTAFWCGPGAQAADVARGFTQVLGDSRYKASAQAFARRYTAFSPAEQRRRIIHSIEALLAGGAILSPPSNTQGTER